MIPTSQPWTCFVVACACSGLELSVVFAVAMPLCTKVVSYLYAWSFVRAYVLRRGRVVLYRNAAHTGSRSHAPQAAFSYCCDGLLVFLLLTGAIVLSSRYEMFLDWICSIFVLF